MKKIKKEKVVESPPKEKEELNKFEVEQKFTQLKREINRILIFSTYFYFNLMLHRFIWKVDYNCPDDCGGYIKFKSPNATEIENGTIHISAKMIANEKFTAKNLLFILVHELLHIIFLHNVRTQDRNRKLWNIATDQVINALIKRTFPRTQDIEPFGGYGKSGGCIYYEKINNDIINDPKLSAEDIYEIMKKYFKRWKVTKLFFEDGTEQAIGDDDNKSDSEENNSLPGSGFKKVTSYEVTDEDTGDKFIIGAGESDKDTQNAVEQFSRIAGEIYNNFKSRGVGCGGLSEVFEEFFKTDLPWNQILENIIHKSVTLQPNSRGWQTLNKKFIPHGYTLPGILFDEDVKIDTGVVSIDTSGSISSSDLQKFADILIESLDYFNKIIMITHDGGIQQVEKFQSYDKEKLKNFIQSIGFRGRGGTSHNEVFQKIQELHDQSYNGISLYLSLTDGYSDIDHCWNETDWGRKNEIPTCFILTENHCVPKICQSDDNNESSTRAKHVVIERRRN